MEKVEYDHRHGGPFDRGSADSYYQRGMRPHYYKSGTHASERVERVNMTEAELEAYQAGFDYNEEIGSFKDWG